MSSTTYDFHLNLPCSVKLCSLFVASTKLRLLNPPLRKKSWGYSPIKASGRGSISSAVVSVLSLTSSWSVVFSWEFTGSIHRQSTMSCAAMTTILILNLVLMSRWVINRFQVGTLIDFLIMDLRDFSFTLWGGTVTEAWLGDLPWWDGQSPSRWLSLTRLCRSVTKAWVKARTALMSSIVCNLLSGIFLQFEIGKKSSS